MNQEELKGSFFGLVHCSFAIASEGMKILAKTEYSPLAMEDYSVAIASLRSQRLF